MAATGFTPISTYYTTTAGATPTAGNLVNGELALNIHTSEGKLFYKDSAGTVQVLASKATGTVAGSTTQVIYNNAGAYAGSANMTFNGTTLTLANDASISGLTVGKGGGAVASNTAVGSGSLTANTTGSSNTVVGQNSLSTNSTGNNNTAVGQGVLYYATGSANSAFGHAALQNTSTGANNTAVGDSALQANTTASNNTAVGYQALYSNQTGSSTAFGYKALYSNTASSNVAVGNQVLRDNTTGNGNSALGDFALVQNTTGTANTAIGYTAGFGVTTGSNNTAIGYNSNNAGNNSNNTTIGYSSGSLLTTGSKNTILGSYTGNQGGLDIRTASNYIVLSDGDGNPRGVHTGTSWNWNANGRTLNWDNAQFYPSLDGTILLGFPSFRWNTVYATTGTINTSDATQKQDIESLDDSEKRVAVRIKGLVKKFRFKDAVTSKGDDARIHVGVIAQEVQAAFIAEGLDPNRYAMFCSDTWYEIDGKAGKPESPYTADMEGAVEVNRLGIRYEELLAFVISTL